MNVASHIKTCGRCSAAFVSKQAKAKWCSARCRQAAARERWGTEYAERERAHSRHRDRQYDPQKRRAWNAVMHEIRMGRLERGECEICGEPNAEAHHDDYSKPLDVRWLCRAHHEEEHHPVLAGVALGGADVRTFDWDDAA